MTKTAKSIQKTYVLVPGNCTGCRTCELACSMVKSVDGNLGLSRITVIPLGKDKYVQLNCLQCAEAACAKVCPVGALKRNELTGSIEVLEDMCIKCSACEAACPFGHIRFNEGFKAPLKCDLCGGSPACARFCPHQALQMR